MERNTGTLNCALKALRSYQKKVPNYQHGFRKKYCTLDALSTFVSDIYYCFSKNKYITLINKVDISILIDKIITIYPSIMPINPSVESSPSVRITSIMIIFSPSSYGHEGNEKTRELALLDFSKTFMGQNRSAVPKSIYKF